MSFPYNSNGQMKEPVSIVISSQVGDRSTPSVLPRNNPVTLKFDHDAVSCHALNE